MTDHDQLSAARGAVFGMILGMIAWAVIIGAYLVLT